MDEMRDMNPNTSTTDSHNDELHIENQRVSLPVFNSQDHLGSAPQISVTESTPETQRKSNQLQPPPGSVCSTDTKAQGNNEGETLIDVISHGQRGRMEDQRCRIDPSRSAPCSPQNTERKSTIDSKSGLENETFLNLLSSSQSKRMDDQRVSLPSLPGVQKDQTSSSANPESNYLCYMVSKVQGSRMDDQRCSLPQIITTLKSPNDDGSERTRSASFCTDADIHPSSSTKGSNPAEQDGFFTMISRSQRRMDDQRCELKVSPKTAHKKNEPAQQPSDANYLCYMVSKVQLKCRTSRLSSQRLRQPTKILAERRNARHFNHRVQKMTQEPSLKRDNACTTESLHRHLYKNMSPSFQRKDCAKTLQRSSSLNRNKSTQKPEISEVQEEQFVKMMKHAQRGRMDEQRCSLPSSTPATPIHNGSALNNKPLGADTDAFFRTLATSQSRRLDDQRAELPVMSKTPRGTPNKKQNDMQRHNALYKRDSFSKSAPQITVTQSTPTSSKKEFTRPVSQLEPGYDVSAGQVTVKVSMSFSSLQGLTNPDQPNHFPELFLTLGAPGENLRIPLSPVPGRRLSLSLNLVPKDGVDSEQTSLIHPSPKKSRSGQSSPQEDEMFVAITQTVKGQTTPIKKGQKQKGKAKDKSTQEKGKKITKKDKNGNKR